MVPTSVFWVVVLAALIPQTPVAQAIPSSRFVGTWVGTQSWAIQNAPPGARPDQPVTLTIEEKDGKLVGTMKPFLGGEDGATFVEAAIVGDELQASAIVGRPRPAAGGSAARGASGGAPTANGDPETATAPVPGGRGGGRGFAPSEPWKAPLKVAFSFKNNGVSLVGTADVMMNDAKWLKFKYDLSRKRSRY